MPMSRPPPGWKIIDVLDTLLYVRSYSNNVTTRDNARKDIENITDWCTNTLN